MTEVVECSKTTKNLPAGGGTKMQPMASLGTSGSERAVVGFAYVYNHDAGVRPSFATITRLIRLPQAINWCRVLASRRCRLWLVSLALEYEAVWINDATARE